MDEQYKPQEIEEEAQLFWEKHHCFNASEDPDKEKFYCLTQFPYPSGLLHIGHSRVYTIGDVVSRYQRMLGKNVMQPMGWDAFGLPAENAAIKNNIPPAAWTYKNIESMRNQLKRLGYGYDWSREITTCHPSYYRWEQWFFLKLYEKGLVYNKKSEVNWDPVDQTVLANEQVVDGRGWRSGALVERREIPQWFLKITDYAEELLNDLDKLKGWPEQVKTMQRNWIGRSVGVEITFQVINNEPITLFTTRPDTIYGVTYIAIAPQHPLAKQAAENQPELKSFLDECKNIKVAEAELATMPKKGVATGLYAIHPITNEQLPIWVANFVVMNYASGAVMAVPSHDQRDFEFAQQYHLPLKQVIAPNNQTTWDYSKGALVEYGELINSGQFTGLTSADAIQKIIQFLENHGSGKSKIHYRLRDWGISRQRYWGAPIPIIHCKTCGMVPVHETDLPVILPEQVQFSGVTSPLKSIPEFYETTCPTCQKPAVRETDTFDTFIESSWYYARFACKQQDNMMLDDRANYWLPVDQYFGGIEHAVLHLLYARFFHKAMRDIGLVNSDEPFTSLVTQGMVLNQGVKMSKSKGNVVAPETLIERFGADTARLFIIFAAPPEQSLEWSDSGVEGAHRFLKRLWAFGYEKRDMISKQNHAEKSISIDWDSVSTENRAIMLQLYEILEQVKYDYERLQLNTVVSGCMKLFNILVKITSNDDTSAHILHQGTSILLRLLAPIAPHITHKLWQELHYDGLLLTANWPQSNSAALKVEHIELVVQINGKLRSRITVSVDADEKTIQEIALQDTKVKQTMTDRVIKKVIVVPKKLINIVATEK
jgi:leucyl-tRNA synthetase